MVDHTRGGVLNALYQQVSAWEVPAVAEGPVACMEALGVVKGREGGDLALDGVCTLQEALVMAQRLVLNVYDLQDAGSKGLLWKAEGNGNTLDVYKRQFLDMPLRKALPSIFAGVCIAGVIVSCITYGVTAMF